MRLTRTLSSPATLRTASNESGDERNDEQHQENEEQELCDFRGADRDAAEAEQRSDQRDHEKNCGIVQHDVLSPKFARRCAPGGCARCCGTLWALSRQVTIG